MTIDEFLVALRIHAKAGRWILDKLYGYRSRYGIRTDDNLLTRQCPITCVAGVYGSGGSHLAGLRLGLPWDAIAQIVSAADEEPGHDPALRQALLAAVGLA